MAEVASALYSVETLVEGAVALAKGVYDPTLPLKATIVPITDVDLPRAYHSISVIKGRAYVFGGKQGAGDAELADNAMHVIVLPSSGIESTDYQRLDPSSASPPARYGHSATVIDDQIYIFGGSDPSGSIEENGRVWAFDTTTTSWSSLDPTTGERPSGKTFAFATATDQPKPEHERTDENIAPQLPPDPAKMVPEPPEASTYGTILISGGVSGTDQKSTQELWAFDISSKTWFSLPALPSHPNIQSPSISMIGSTLYTTTGLQTHVLHLDTKSAFSSKSGVGNLGLSPLGPWAALSPPSISSETPFPSERSAAALLPITTGQGRNYLLLLGGGDEEDIWTLQLHPEGMTAASFKDAARMAMKKDTAEVTWAEVRYYGPEGVLVQEGQLGRGIGERKGFAADRAAEIDGGTVVVWGGIGGGKVRGDGLIVKIEK